MSDVEVQNKPLRVKAKKKMLLEIVDENGNPMNLKPEQIKVLCIFTKVNEEVYNISEQHPNKIKIEFE